MRFDSRSELWEGSGSSLELEFHPAFPGKGGQALEGAQGGLELPSPEVSKEQLDAGLGDQVGMGPRLDSMTLEHSFPTSVILGFCDHPVFHISIVIKFILGVFITPIPTFLVFPDPTGKQNARSRYRG